MKIAISTIDLLGAVIGERTIKLQPHIIKKIVKFNEEELKTKKRLRSFLGILNYARNHILKLGILLRPFLINRRWIKFADAVTRTGVKINLEHIEGKHNTLADALSRLVNLCFAECTGEMKQLAASALYLVEEVLQIFPKAIFTHEELGALYRHYQLKANQTPIRMDKSNAWRLVAQDIKLSAAKEAVKSIRSLQAIIQCKAQICFGMSTKDNYWSNQREDVRIQNKEAIRILIELEALA
ncbi:hypothetical protein Tco_0970378 [Tanacetum coccineum]